MRRPIAPGLSPNITSIDVKSSLGLLFTPWKYRHGNAVATLEQWFRNTFSISFAVAFTSARGALYAILKELPIEKGDEVIVQAFTCAAVIQPILSAGAKPVFVDCSVDLTISIEDLKKKISKKTKVIIFQYTFGTAGQLDEVRKIAKNNNIFLIEDAAHTIGGEYKGKKLGTFGNAAIFSFGRDKAFSSVSGGIVITKDKTLGKKIRMFQRQRDDVSTQWILSNLLHPILMYFFIMPYYDFFSVGKVFLVTFQKVGLLSKPVDIKRTTIIPEEIKKLPNAMAEMMLTQLSSLTVYNKRRKTIAGRYQKELDKLDITHAYHPDTIYLRFPIFVDDPEKIKVFFRKRKIYLGDWYSNIIDPKGISLKKFGYQKGVAACAEYAASHIVNLPTYPTMEKEDIDHVIEVLQAYAQDTTNTR